MQAFSVSSKYISDLITKSNLILIIVILVSTSNPVPAFAFNAFIIFKFYNAA